MQRLLSAWAWIAAVSTVIVGFFYVAAVWMVTAPFDRGHYHAGRAFRQLAVTAVSLNPLWHFETDGDRPADPRHPYVAVSNHESYADIFLISHFPWEMKWLSKDTIFKIPVMGWMMRMAKDIPIERGKRESVVSALRGCRDRLAKHVSVMIFPEGTRSRTAELLPFKDGAFKLAIEAGVPILPIAVAGTRHCMAKGSFAFRRARAKARVLPPIPTTGLTHADVAALRDRTRDLIDAARHTLQRELDAEHRGADSAADATEAASV
jgi:1-acyl-sn-glycerol-3-phosphate acyltransferase